MKFILYEVPGCKHSLEMQLMKDFLIWQGHTSEEMGKPPASHNGIATIHVYLDGKWIAYGFKGLFHFLDKSALLRCI